MNEIEKFLDRVQKSVKAQSREIRLSMAEAQALSSELGKLLSKENKLLEKIVVLQENQNQNANVTLNDGVTMDGGQFKEN